jgi:phenolic acid decarboxylase
MSSAVTAPAKATNAGTVESLVGRTVRWTFADGPVAGKTYEHTFNADGSVVYRSVDGEVPGKSTRERVCATDRISDGIFVVSYLAVSGYTLTVVLDFQNHRMVGFASNEEAWYRQHGTFELAGGES